MGFGPKILNLPPGPMGPPGPQGPPGDGANLPTGVFPQVLGYDTNGVVVAEQLTQDMILPAFAISSFAASGFSTSQECGATITNPAFTASYTSTPTSASTNEGSGAQAWTTPFTSKTTTGTYTKSVPNQTVVWTLTAIGATTKTSTVTATWKGRYYYGIATPATLNEAFIEALPSSALATTYTGSFAIGAGSNTKRAYLAFPSSFGTPSTFKDAATGFAVPMSLVASAVSVTNANGATFNYDIWASDNLLASAFTLSVS